MAADFEYYAKSFSLGCVCLYGGTQYAPQEGILRRGVDIVIGTPGRVKDHLERGTLNLRCATCQRVRPPPSPPCLRRRPHHGSPALRL